MFFMKTKDLLYRNYYNKKLKMEFAIGEETKCHSMPLHGTWPGHSGKISSHLQKPLFSVQDKRNFLQEAFTSILKLIVRIPFSAFPQHLVELSSNSQNSIVFLEEQASIFILCVFPTKNVQHCACSRCSINTQCMIECINR